MHLSFAKTDAEARENAFDQWRSNVMTPQQAAGLRTPADFDRAAEHVRPKDLDEHVVISASTAEHIDRIAAFAELGFEEIYLHNVGRNQQSFIEAFGTHVLPALQKGA